MEARLGHTAGTPQTSKPPAGVTFQLLVLKVMNHFCYLSHSEEGPVQRAMEESLADEIHRVVFFGERLTHCHSSRRRGCVPSHLSEWFYAQSWISPSPGWNFNLLKMHRALGKTQRKQSKTWVPNSHLFVGQGGGGGGQEH